MRFLASVFCALLFSANLSATMLCDNSCDLSISFPDGGEIQATESLTLNFGSAGALELGDTGTVNTNPQPADLDYSSGGTLLLNKGDSISFDVNGSIVLGEGGNIDYSAMRVNSSGQLNVKAVGGSETLVIQNLQLGTDLVVILEAAVIRIVGEFTLTSNVTFNAGSAGLQFIFGSENLSPVASGCTSTSTDGGLVLSSGASSTLDLTVGCAMVLNTPIITGANISVFDPGQSLITSVDGGAVFIATASPGVLVLDEPPVEQKNAAGLVSLTGFFLLLLLRLLLKHRQLSAARRLAGR